MSTNNRSKLTKYLFPLIAIGLIFWVYKTINPEEILISLKGANYLWVVLAMLAGLISHFVRAVRWKLLIEPMGYEVGVKTSFYAVMIGYMVNYVTPRMGEVARCALKSRTDKIPVDKLVGTVFTERVFDVLVMALITLFGFLSQYNLIMEFLSRYSDSSANNTVKILVLVALVVMGLAGLFIYNKLRKRENNPPVIEKVLGFIAGLLDGAKTIFKLKRPFLFLFYTFIIWLMYFLVSYLIFFALDGTSHLGLDAAVTTLVVATAAVIIPAPGGLGSFHYFVPRGLVLYGIDLTLGTSYAIISHASQMLMIFIFGGISMLLTGFLQKGKNDETHSETAV